MKYIKNYLSNLIREEIDTVMEYQEVVEAEHKYKELCKVEESLLVQKQFIEEVIQEIDVDYKMVDARMFKKAHNNKVRELQEKFRDPSITKQIFILGARLDYLLFEEEGEEE